MVLLLAIAVVLAACALPQQPGSPEQAGRATADFLEALVTGRVEYAWERLTPATRDATYQDDRDAFARDVETADWSDFRWTIGPITDYDISWGVHVEVSPESVPTFLLDRHLVAPFDKEGVVLLVQVTDDARYVVAGQGLDSDLR